MMNGFNGILGARATLALDATADAAASPADQASQAIKCGDFRSLVQQLLQGSVNGNTRNQDGGSLLVHALRHADQTCGAFVLLADHMHRQHIAPDLPPRDVEDDTLLHFVARLVPDEFFDDGLPPAGVVKSMRDWISCHTTQADLACRNRDGRTPIELARDRNHPNTARFLEALQPAPSR